MQDFLTLLVIYSQQLLIVPMPLDNLIHWHVLSLPDGHATGSDDAHDDNHDGDDQHIQAF